MCVRERKRDKRESVCERESLVVCETEKETRDSERDRERDREREREEKRERASV